MKIRKKYLFYLLAFLSSIIAALLTGIDVILEKVLKSPWVLGLSIFYFGVLISLIFTLILSISYKGNSIGSKIIDPTFKKIRFPKKKEIIYHLLAGMGNAVLTIGYFSLLIIIKDPSVVLPFSQVVILYLVIIESVTEKNTPTLVEVQSSIIVTFGAILGSISVSGTINLEALLIVFFVINPGWVLFSIFQRKLKLLKINNKSNDAVNIRLWNVIFACFFTVLFTLTFDSINNTNNFLDSLYSSMDYFLWLILIGIGTFFSYIFYIRALGIGKASVTQAVRSSIIIFTIPVSIILAYFGYIAPITANPVLVLIKIIGIALIILGIVSFALTLIKAYIFIKLKSGYPIEETLQKLWNIKGVDRVCAVAGNYDVILKIRTRTLVKGYENILRKLESIKEIQEFKWQSVLKEWENI
jgi:DNA-binding Lrp family transcriptional regulator